MLNRSSERGNLWLVPDLREKAFSLSPPSMILSVRFSYMVLMILRQFPSIYSLFDVLS